MIINTDYSRYVLTFDEDLQLVHLYEFESSYYASTASTYCSAFISGYSKTKGAFGALGSTHKLNALDLIMKLNKKCQFAVLNFDNYQLLFTDDKVSGETMVYKVE